MHTMDVTQLKNEKACFDQPMLISKQQVNIWNHRNLSIVEKYSTSYNKKQLFTPTPRLEKMYKNSLRVLIYTACYNVMDGVTITIRKIESAIIEAGGSVCVVTTGSGNKNNTNLVPEHPRRKVLFLDDAVLLPFTESGKDSDQEYYLGKSLSADDLSIMSEFNPTVVHITVPDCVGLQVIEYARDNGIPLMGTYHSNIIDYMDHYGTGFLKCVIAAYFNHTYGFLQTLYVPTPYMKQYLTESVHYRIHKATNLKVWGRGIDLNTFNPQHRCSAFRASLSIEPNEVVFLFVGRLVHEKRPDIFANVMRRLSKEDIRFKALVVGAGPYESEMNKLPNTICVGWLSNIDDLATAYASSDIFLFPGALETFGNVTMEAAASGLPIVAEAGCSGHLIEHGVSGFACPDGDEDAFFEAAHRLAVDNLLRNRFSSASRRLSLKYDKSIVMSEMIDNYHATINEFDTEYKGCHFIRDKSWKSKLPNSFPGGQIPYPWLLRFLSNLILPNIGFFAPLLFAVQNCLGVLQKVRMYFSQENKCDKNEELSDLESSNDRSISSAPLASNLFLTTFCELLTTVAIACVRFQSNRQYSRILTARRKEFKHCE